MASSRRLTSALTGVRIGGLGLVVACLVALTLGSAPANAASVSHESSTTRSYDEVRWDCGYPMRVVGKESHQVTTRADKKLADVVYVTDKYEFQEVWTAPDGRSFSQTGHGVAKDLPAKPVGGTVYQFAFRDSGTQAEVKDSRGRVVARDRGTLTWTYTIDMADGTFTFLGLTIKGPHPVFTLGLCKVVAPLTGNGSARYLTPRPLGSTGSAMGYYEYLPPSYKASGTKSPLLLAFNGYGENGDGTPAGLSNLVKAGIPKFIDVGGWPTSRPLVVLAAQHIEQAPGFDFGPCDALVIWNGSCDMQLQHDRNDASPSFCTTPDEVHDFVTYAVAHYNVDPKRVYVTGLSCGAFGVWEYLAKYGNAQVAAAVTIAGNAVPAWATAGCGLGSVPIWDFHGELDDVVNPQDGIVPMASLAACPGVTPDRAKETVYPGLYHDGWDQAYSGSLGDDIYTWMLGFSRP
jgi:hypothetical protein